jgi:hypothetical protein
MRITSLCFVSLLAACAVSEDEAPTPASGPEIKADGNDAADRGCQIVLRTLAQPGGLPSNNVNGVNWVVYHGFVDVAEGAAGTPAALFASRSTNGWWKVTAQPVDGAVDGYQRYRFVLDRNTVPMGDSTSWRSMRIDVIPYLEGADGSRLFDHNRYTDDFANYVLTKDETRYGDDPAACH